MKDRIVVAGARRIVPSARRSPAKPRYKAATACALAGAAAVIISLMAASAHATTISAGQVDNVDAGETEDSDLVFSGGIQNVNSGGTALNTRIDSGGTQNVNNRGVVSGTAPIGVGAVLNVNNGGTSHNSLILVSGTENVGVGGVESGGSASGGGIQNISGGTAFHTFVIADGTQNVFNGGIASSALVTSVNATQIINSGGTALQTTISFSGRQEVLAGGSAIGSIVSGGGSQIVSTGAFVSGTTLIDGFALQLINSGATVVDTELVSDGATQNVPNGATAVRTLINSGTVQTIAGGGLAIAATISASGTQSVAAGGNANGTTLYGGGIQLISSGGTVTDTHVLSGGVQNVNAGAIAIHTDINDGSIQNIGSGGMATNTEINPGTTQTIASGGLAVAATIASAGTQIVAAGANANETKLLGDGIQEINSGGTVTDTHVVSGGVQNVTAGATAIHSEVGDGSIQNVSSGGVAINTEIDLGGLQVILAAALVSGTLINVGGSAAARQTGVSLSDLILNGGTLWLNDPQAGVAKPASFNQVTVNGLSGSGTVSFATEFTALSGDQLTLQNGQGTLGVTVRDYSTTDGDPTQRLLLITTDAATTAQATLNGRYVDVGAFEYGLVKDGNQYFLAAKTVEPATPGSGGGSNLGGGSGGTPGGDGGGGGGGSGGSGGAGADSADDGIGGTNGLVPTDTTQTVVAAAKAAGAIWYDQLQQVQKRFGDLRSSIGNDGAWVRGYGDERHLYDPGVKIDEGGIQAGVDHRIRNNSGDWIVGLTAGAGYAGLDMGASGTGNATQWNIGVYGLWLNDAGWYASTTAKYNALNQHVSSVTGEGIPVSAAYSLSGYTVSFEGGRRFLFDQGWFVEPQAEWTLTHGGAASYTTNTGLPVNVNAATAQMGRVGVSFGEKIELSDQDFVEPYMRLSVVRQFSGDNAVVVAGSPFDVSTRSTYGVVSIGATAKYRKQLQFYGELGYARGSNYAMPWSINAGLRYTW